MHFSTYLELALLDRRIFTLLFLASWRSPPFLLPYIIWK